MFEFSKSELFRMLFIFIAVLISWFIFPVDSNFQPIFTSALFLINQTDKVIDFILSGNEDVVVFVGTNIDKEISYTYFDLRSEPDLNPQKKSPPFGGLVYFSNSSLYLFPVKSPGFTLSARPIYLAVCP